VSKRALLTVVCTALLAVPAGASARVIEYGANTDPVAASCPVDCTALSRATGYQGRSGKLKNPLTFRAKGKIVAFTVQLGKPAPEQIAFFAPRFGGDASVRLSIFRQGKKKNAKRSFRLLRQSPVYKLNDFFGSAPTFALDKPLPVTKGYVAAITSPTWAPIFATAKSQPSQTLSNTNWWRASRTKAKDNDCKSISRDATVTKLGSVTTFGCDYFGVRLLYTVTYIPDPVPTVKK
jgi:hypothetical protein